MHADGVVVMVYIGVVLFILRQVAVAFLFSLLRRSIIIVAWICVCVRCAHLWTNNNNEQQQYVRCMAFVWLCICDVRWAFVIDWFLLTLLHIHINIRWCVQMLFRIRSFHWSLHTFHTLHFQEHFDLILKRTHLPERVSFAFHFYSSVFHRCNTQFLNINHCLLILMQDPFLAKQINQNKLRIFLSNCKVSIRPIEIAWKINL